MSATRHSSRTSMDLTASLASLGTGSGVLAVATCTGGVSVGSICDEGGNAASTIDPGSPDGAVAVSVGLTASLASFETGSGVLAVATCTGGVSGGSICGEAGNAASTIDSGSSDAAVVSVAVCVTGSAAVATSALATTALLIAVAWGASASSGSAARDGARRSSVGTAPPLSMPAEPRTANEARTQIARTTVPHNAAPTVGNGRAFMMP